MPVTITAPAITATIRERVERGAAWLDEIQPGWRNRVNVRLLSMDCGDDCILGQVFADVTSYFCGYLYAYYTFFGGDEDQIIAYGFEAPLLRNDDRDYSTLTAAWQHYLTDGMW